jgi:hypothetical protein
MRSACHFTQWKINAIALHHCVIKSWIVSMSSVAAMEDTVDVWSSSCGYF